MHEKFRRANVAMEAANKELVVAASKQRAELETLQQEHEITVHRLETYVNDDSAIKAKKLAERVTQLQVGTPLLCWCNFVSHTVCAWQRNACSGHHAVGIGNSIVCDAYPPGPMVQHELPNAYLPSYQVLSFELRSKCRAWRRACAWLWTRARLRSAS